MPQMLQEFFTHPDFWKYLSIPIVAAFVGWSTNWIAIKMLFYPIKPIGWPPFLGWQGILPAKAARMGAITVDTTLSKLGSLEEVFQTMEPDRIAKHLVDSIEPRVEDYVEWVMNEENPQLWDLMPKMVKTYLYATVRSKLPSVIKRMIHDISQNITEMVDLKELVIKQLLEEREIVNKIFLKCGEVEFRFIVRSGIYFGLLFGLVQMGVWYYYPEWWILPLFGMIVGYATNWIALRIIFQPLRPKKIGPFVLQGLFLKRQEEVSEIWCDIVAREIITVHNIIHNMLYGSKSEYTQIVIRKYIREIIDDAVGLAKPVVQFTVGMEDFLKIKDSASEKVIKLTSAAFDDEEFSLERARLVKELMRERMVKLSSEEFQYLLRPAFQEDEMKLILLGAALGFAAGMAQLFWVFGGM